MDNNPKIIDISNFREKKAEEEKKESAKKEYIDTLEKFEDIESFEDELFEKYGINFESIGDELSYILRGMEIELEELQKGLHSVDKVSNIKNDIKKYDEELKKWNKLYPQYKKLQRRLYNLDRKLVRLLNDNEYAQFFRDLGYEDEDLEK